MTVARFLFTQDICETYDSSGTRLDRSDSQSLCNLLYGGRIRDVGLLPPAVRWMAADGAAVIVERPPAEVVLNYNSGVVAWLPWTVWVLRWDSPLLGTLTDVKVFARSHALMSSQDELGLLPLPGVLPDGSITFVSPDHILRGSPLLGDVVLPVIEFVLGLPRTSADWVLTREHAPAEWPVDDVEAVLRHMATAQHIGLTFSNYVAAPTRTFGDLITSLDPKLDEAADDVLEFLGKMVSIAAKASS